MKKMLLLSFFMSASLIIAADLHSSNLLTPICTQDAPLPIGPFSQAMLVQNPQNLLFISGQLPINPITNILETDPALAAAQCMENLFAILQAAGMNFSDVAKTTIYLADIKDFAVINGVYESFLTAPYPARVTFQAGALPKGACIEIEMIAVQ